MMDLREALSHCLHGAEEERTAGERRQRIRRERAAFAYLQAAGVRLPEEWPKLEAACECSREEAESILAALESARFVTVERSEQGALVKAAPG